MIFVATFFVVVTVKTVSNEKHSLTYIYTAFSKPVNLPGIHEFTAMGLLDDRMIDYYDSTIQKKIPKQKWMEERLQPEYWDKGTQSRQSKQQWFRVNIDILINRMRQSSNETHILQWMHGCEGVEDKNGNLQFVRGVDMYNYDGDDFLGFDDKNQVWVTGTDQAVPTKRKWDEVAALRDYTKGYLEKECMEWMKTFLTYSQQQQRNATPPEVHVFTTKSKVPSNVVLTCLATGFYPKDITLNIRRDGRILNEEDGLNSSGVRPNHDDTFQRRDYVEILRRDNAEYTCEVINEAIDMRVKKTWDPLEETFSAVPVGIATLYVLLCLIAVVAVVVFITHKQKGIFRDKYRPPEKHGSSVDSNDSAIGGFKDCVSVHETELPFIGRVKGSSVDSNDSAIGGCD